MLGTEGQGCNPTKLLIFFSLLDLPVQDRFVPKSRGQEYHLSAAVAPWGPGDPTPLHWAPDEPSERAGTLHGGGAVPRRGAQHLVASFSSRQTPQTSIVQGNPFGTGLKSRGCALAQPSTRLWGQVWFRFTMYHPDVPRGPRRHWVPKIARILSYFNCRNRGRSRGFRRCQPRGPQGRFGRLRGVHPRA